MKRRAIFGWMMVVCLGLAALVVAAGYVFGRANLAPEEYQEALLAEIVRSGVGAEVIGRVRSVRPAQVTVCVVREVSGGDVYEFCTEAGYSGRSRRVAGPGPGGPVYTTSRTVLAPDGDRYYVMMWRQGMHDIYRFMATLVFLGFLGGWVSLGLWVHADARVRGSRATAGWLLLTLMTGPVGLAVWLVARSEPVPKPLCPGCGADMVPGTMFCVRCGHPLHPACPECGRQVEPDWAHCGTCGASLGEEGGGEHGVLAHENGA
ncbi:MAG TPA: zinc ribbon domain-containing protein [Symbiobacteriaceae bacterium]|nr:zinc ribbon domain-containing protein [Symbiobacteriaceae bacterium]